MAPIIENNRTILTQLCEKYRVKRLEVFGSAASEAFDPLKSDVDFLVVLQSMDPGTHSDAYFGLLEALENLFQREVDLVEIEAVDNPYFLAGINRTRTVLYAA